MISLLVQGINFSYPVFVGADLLPRLGDFVRSQGIDPPRRCVIITDKIVVGLFGKICRDSLSGADFICHFIEVPEGEAAKRLDTVEMVAEQMVAGGLDRSSFLIALGGGALGDLAGFVAATFHRGIPWINVPTTLLAQVDSSIGGKTGVNLASGKNLLGAVHQPIFVLSDTSALRTLPEREFRQGLAEVIKHGIIADRFLLIGLRDVKSDDLPELVRRNVAIKAQLVRSDVNDRDGTRALLNFGHTLGHAIEKAGNFTLLRHGEAVSLGLLAACSISTRRAGLSVEEYESVRETVRACGLPTTLPAGIEKEEILRAVRHDKKFEQGAPRFVVTTKLGSAYLTSDVSLSDMEAAVAELSS